MSYTSDWEPLANVLRRIIANVRSVCLGASDDFRPDFLGYVPHYTDKDGREKQQAVINQVLALNCAARTLAK